MKDSFWSQLKRRIFSCAPRFFVFRQTPLVPLIKQIIRQSGSLTIEQYMELVLQHPDYGYYRQGDPIGAAGDFHTAPEVSQMFGEMLGLWCLDEWHKMGKPARFILLELGPGHGSLMHDLLSFTESIADFHQAIQLRLFESNATLRALQQQKLAKWTPKHIDDFSQLEDLPILALSNELFDNIPLRQFVKTEQGWRERLVTLHKNKLVLAESEETFDLPPDPYGSPYLATCKTGWVHEFSTYSQSLIKQLAAHMVRCGGAGAFIDYGYTTPSGEATLDAWSHLRPTDILSAPGQTDVTADVDFAALQRVAKEQGVKMAEVLGQGTFLLTLGIKERADFLISTTTGKATERVRSDFNELTSSLKMGDIWKVLVVRG